MSSIISFKNRWKNGQVSQADLSLVWKNEPQEPLIALLERFEVAYYMRGASSDPSMLMIPSLLPETPDKSQFAKLWPTLPPVGTQTVCGYQAGTLAQMGNGPCLVSTNSLCTKLTLFRSNSIGKDLHLPVLTARLLFEARRSHFTLAHGRCPLCVENWTTDCLWT